MPIDFSPFEKSSNFVKFVAGVPKVLELVTVSAENRDFTNEAGQKKQLYSLMFAVTKEDGITVEKTWSITSKALAIALKPIVAQIEAGQTKTLKLTKFGSKFETFYKFAVIENGKELVEVSTEPKK